MPISFQTFLDKMVSLPQDPVYYYSLYQYCQLLPSPAFVVEIGTWKGHSTIAMACALQGTGGHIMAIDPIFTLLTKEEMNPEPRLWTSSFAEVSQRIAQFKLEGYISLVPDFSENILARWDGRLIDLLHVDGNHTYEAVRRDCEWMQWVKNGGYVTFDDWAVYSDIIPLAVKDYLSSHPEFVILHAEGENPCSHPTWSTAIIQRQNP
jgi:hypothetical protein